MCTVVCAWRPGRPTRILALRDELTSRAFDLPGAWWPDQPGVIGGRDRVAGGSWCVTDVRSGTTALVLNRSERREGTPSRGGLPLAAIAAGEGWPTVIDPARMAAFTLLLAGPASLVAWTWDARTLRRDELPAGEHMITTNGVDTQDARTATFAPRFATSDWREVVGACTPSDEPAALVIRHEVGASVYATVFGQLISSGPGRLELHHSRTPWLADSWTDQVWPG